MHFERQSFPAPGIVDAGHIVVMHVQYVAHVGSVTAPSVPESVPES